MSVSLRLKQDFPHCRVSNDVQHLCCKAIQLPRLPNLLLNRQEDTVSGEAYPMTTALSTGDPVSSSLCDPNSHFTVPLGGHVEEGASRRRPKKLCRTLGGTSNTTSCNLSSSERGVAFSCSVRLLPPSWAWLIMMSSGDFSSLLAPAQRFSFSYCCWPPTTAWEKAWCHHRQSPLQYCRYILGNMSPSSNIFTQTITVNINYTVVNVLELLIMFT